MSEQRIESGWYRASAVSADTRPHLKFGTDADICVIGGGVAGLSVALEAVRRGATVAVIEARQIGWNASSASLGVVAPGFGNDVSDLVTRLGRDHARELWSLSRDGVESMRLIASEVPDASLTDGLLEVSTTDNGDQLVSRLQTLSEVFGAEVEGWQSDQVRGALNTKRYFHGIHHPKAFHLHAPNYIRGLAALAQRAGVQIFEQTVVTSIDAAGIRKRIMTPDGRVRAGAIVLAGNVHLGSLFPRLVRTLLPVWRFAAVTEPLGERLAHVMSYAGAIQESDGGNLYRVIDGNRLLWSGPVRARDVEPKRLSSTIQSDIQAVFPQLGKVRLAETWSGVTGETVHGMPQIGQMHSGLWIASGFGGQGFNTAAMAARLIVSGILSRDDRWRLFAPYELVWTGGLTGRLVGQAVYSWTRQRASLAGALARRRERVKGKRAAKDAQAESI